MRKYYTNFGLEVSHGILCKDVFRFVMPRIYQDFVEKCFSIFSCYSEINREQTRRKTQSRVSQNTPCRIPQEGNPRGVNLLRLLWIVRNYFLVSIAETHMYVVPAHERPLILIMFLGIIFTYVLGILSLYLVQIIY
jgi:hypothetical protein